MSENRCVVCGSEIPEGMQTCLICEDGAKTEQYKLGYNNGVRDFAKRIREKDRTWSISEIEKEL
jgi:hypothetical protein